MPPPALALTLARALADSLDNTPTRFQARLTGDLEQAHATAAAPQAHALSSPLMAHLDSLASAMPSGHVSDVVAPLMADLNWYLIYQSATDRPALSNGIAAGQLIGKRGLWRSNDLLAAPPAFGARTVFRAFGHHDHPAWPEGKAPPSGAWQLVHHTPPSGTRPAVGGSRLSYLLYVDRQDHR